jgi:hypothetical protein
MATREELRKELDAIKEKARQTDKEVEALTLRSDRLVERIHEVLARRRILGR